jgi:MYXO-CTERM domain-containing protein
VVKTWLAPVASLRLTVILLALGLFLVFVGTLAQVHLGILTAVKTYFRSFYVWVPFKIFFKASFLQKYPIQGGFPFVGGWSIGAALLVNVIAAHLVRFRMTWRRSGILILHAGIIMLLCGELVTGLFAVEGNMTIEEGSRSDFLQHNTVAELAVIDSSDAKTDDVVVVPARLLHAGGLFTHTDLPFDLQVQQWMVNSDLTRPNGTNRATAGLGLEMMAVERPEVPGTDQEQRADVPSAYVTLFKKGSSTALGTWLVSPYIAEPQKVTVDGKDFDLFLRFKRTYKPYSVHLKKFTHDKYPGTEIPRDFSSLVKVHDPDEGDREVLIWMNHPLFFKRDAFYQANFDEVDGTKTVLQVVRNPGWWMPYIACLMVVAGMLVHFGVTLTGFLRKRYAAVPALADAGANGSPAPAVAGTAANDGIRAAPPAGVAIGGRSLSRKGRRKGTAAPAAPPSVPATPAQGPRDLVGFVPWAAAFLGVCYFMVAMIPPSTPPNKMQLEEIAALPVQDGGRMKPLDTVARTKLYAVSGREVVYPERGDAISAVQWMLDLVTRSREAWSYKVIRIDNEQVLSFLKLQPRFGLRYSINEVGPSLPALSREVQRVRRRAPLDRDLFDAGIMQLAEKIDTVGRLSDMENLGVLPPAANETKWRSYDTAALSSGQVPPMGPNGQAFHSILKSYSDGDAKEFNKAVGAYQKLVAPDAAQAGGNVHFELFFNNFSPFTHCLVLYLIAFLLGCISWFGDWGRPLARAAFWLVVLTLVVHTFAIITRMYLQGRPPVTNLYSSAIFIGWVGAIIGLCMEPIFRNGIGTVVAAFVAGSTTFLAPYLVDGDSLEMMRAVLDTNFWLATHVTSVTIGYSATIFAGVVGIKYLIALGLQRMGFGISQVTLKSLTTMLYGVICFAMLFSFTGTVLGGIWADASWGRFWGWDPKENGALLIVIWNALILHARWGGLVRERGVAILAIFGINVVLWSYFGTNMLGIGLHSYASASGEAALWFTEGLFLALMLGGLFLTRRRQALPT